MKPVKVRNPILENVGLRLIRPRVFFRHCEVCHMDYKGALMWSWRVYNIEFSYSEYACMDCMLSAEAVFKYVLSDREYKIAMSVPSTNFTEEV